MSDEERFKRIVNLYSSTCDSPEYVYHYTAMDNIPLILKDDCLSFIFTRIDCFEDGLEGKTCEGYYRKAIDMLFKDGRINEKHLKMLGELDCGNNKPFLFRFKNDRESIRCMTEEYDTYVGCFSILPKSRKIVKKYIKNKEHKGGAIGLKRRYLNQCVRHSIGEGFAANLRTVYYGKNAVKYIYETINKLIDNLRDDKEFETILVPVVGMYIMDLKCTTKEKKYSFENEVRIVARVAKNPPFGYERQYINWVNDDKTKLYYSINDKKCLHDIAFFNTSSKERDKIIEGLNKAGYMIRCNKS